MRVFARIAAVGAAAVMVFGVGTAQAGAEREAQLSFQAEQGAWPVSGRLGEWSPVDVWEDDDIVKIDGETDRGFDWIRIELGAGTGSRLAPGTYTDVRNLRTHPEGPGIQIISNGFSCGDDYATVTIERIERSDSGTLTGLDATVEQRCEAPVGPAFRARVHYSV